MQSGEVHRSCPRNLVLNTSSFAVRIGPLLHSGFVLTVNKYDGKIHTFNQLTCHTPLPEPHTILSFSFRSVVTLKILGRYVPPAQRSLSSIIVTSIISTGCYLSLGKVKSRYVHSVFGLVCLLSSTKFTPEYLIVSVTV